MPGIPQPLVSPISFFSTAPITPPGTVSAGSAGEYGLFNVPISNAAGHALVCYIGWNAVAFPSSPVASVADDAHNFWIPLVTTGTGFRMRGAIWIAPNAQPATFVSIATTLPVSSLTATVAELPALPLLSQQGFTPQFSASDAASSRSVSTSAASPVYAFSMAVTGTNTAAVNVPGSPWTALPPVSVNDPFTGAGGPADLTVTPLWGIFPAGTVSAAFTATATLPFDVAMAAILQTPAPIVFKNPNWPALKVEAAFGYQPGDPTAMPSYTDITTRAQNGQGETTITMSRGRGYELTQPEAGDGSIWFDNHDGALTPLNSASSFFPNVVLECPVRVTAIWNNRLYGVGKIAVDKWPQQWPNPQWGMSPMEGSDAMGVLANLTMFSAYQSEVLLDGPYAYWTCDESYGEANGLPFGNLAPANQKPLLGVDGTFSTPKATPLQTGQTLNMQGDTGSGIGVSSGSNNATLPSAGALCVDPGLPQPANGLTVEFWASVDPASVNSSTPLVTLAGPSSNYPVRAGQVRFQVGSVSLGTNLLKTQVILGDFQGNFLIDQNGAMPADGAVHHHIFTLSVTGSTTTVTHYLDGAFDRSFSTSAVNAANDVYELIAGPAIVFPFGAFPYNYALGHIAVYGKVLSNQRIAAHYECGGLGFSGDSAFLRFKRIMAWGQSALPKAADNGSPSPLIGVADTLEGQDQSSALYDVMTSEGGAAYADGQGNVWYQSRVYLYNKQPKWTFGDNPSGGETPYDPATNFDYDNAFLYNQVQASRQIAQSVTIATNTQQGSLVQQFANMGAQETVSDLTSEMEYKRRNSLQQTILTTSDQDVADRANWSLAKYKQPSFRLPSIILRPSETAGIWPVALGVEQGDVVKVIRRPLGAPSYTVIGVVQKVEHEIGPDNWQVTLAISPLNIEQNVLLVGSGSFGTLAEGIGW